MLSKCLIVLLSFVLLSVAANGEDQFLIELNCKCSGDKFHRELLVSAKKSVFEGREFKRIYPKKKGSFHHYVEMIQGAGEFDSIKVPSLLARNHKNSGTVKAYGNGKITYFHCTK